MEKVINLLNDIEMKADKILSRVSNDKARLSDESNQKMKSFDSKVKGKTDKQIAALRLKADKEAEQELLKMKQEQDTYLKQLDEDFDEKCEEYADLIFKRILSFK